MPKICDNIISDRSGVLTIVTAVEINRVLEKLGLPEIKDAELAPLRAA